MDNKPNTLDKLISYFSPQKGAERIASRTRLTGLQAVSNYAGESTKRTLTNWAPLLDDPNNDLNDSLPAMRGKSRELFNTSSIARGAIEENVSNVVGSGLQLESRIESSLLGISPEEAQEKQDVIEKRFRLWAKGTESDKLHMRNFYGLQNQAMLSMLIDGDTLGLLHIVDDNQNRPNAVNPLAIQNIGAHQLCNPNNREDTDKIIGGVEIDKHGAPIAYHVVSPKKGTWNMGSVDGGMTGEWKRITRNGSRTGRLNVVHFFNQYGRPGQYRGVPYLMPVVDMLYQLTKYTKSELTAAVVSSFFTVFVKNESGNVDETLSDFVTPSDSAHAMSVNGMPASQKTTADEHQYQMGPGMVVGLNPNESTETASMNRPNTAFDAFVQSMFVQIGMGLNMPYEVLIRKYQSSYSASRAALLDAWKAFMSRRNWLATYYCQPIYEAWLELEVLNGNIDLPGFLSNPIVRRAWSGTAWHGEAKGMIDPKKEVEASIMLINAPLSNRERETRNLTGEDWYNTIERKSFEDKRLKELGMKDEPVSQRREPDDDEGETDEE